MVQSEHVLEHDFVQVLPFIWSLQRNYLNGCIHQGYGFGGMDSLPTCWYVTPCVSDIVCPLDYFPSIYRTYIEFFLKHFSHYYRKLFELTYGYRRSGGGGGGVVVVVVVVGGGGVNHVPL